MTAVPAEIEAFLKSATPDTWLQMALKQIPTLLLDHANCEKKAASSALSLMFRYPQHDQLVLRMSKLVREELRHYEQVQKILAREGVAFRSVPASSYAATLRAAASATEPGRLVDTLIIGALIEARSCERFALLAPRLPESISAFYFGLLNSEKRHFENYLQLARHFAAGEDIECRVQALATLESELILKDDAVFAFHSGVPGPHLAATA